MCTTALQVAKLRAILPNLMLTKVTCFTVFLSSYQLLYYCKMHNNIIMLACMDTTLDKTICYHIKHLQNLS